MIITSSIAAAAAFLITWLAGIFLIPLLHKLKYGQTILDIGPKWHKAKKEGTPTMGGISFIFAVSVCFAVGMIVFAFTGADFSGAGKRELVVSVSGMIMAVLFGFVGFLDDFIKVRKKRNEGLTPIQKIIFQVLIIAAYFTTIYLSGFSSTVISFPGGAQWDMGLFYYIVMGLGILYIVNAVNLTDGIDGLCSSVTVIYAATFAVISGIFGMFGETLIAFCTAGALLGFLMWNFPPAKVFMGDTGSLFLGGMVVALSYAIGCPLILLLAGIVYVIEGASDVLQIVYYRVSGGKRIFKMAPIHHHFEMCGWSEKKIALVFTIVNAAGGAAAVAVMYYGGYILR